MELFKKPDIKKLEMLKKEFNKAEQKESETRKVYNIYKKKFYKVTKESFSVPPTCCPVDPYGAISIKMLKNGRLQIKFKQACRVNDKTIHNFLRKLNLTQYDMRTQESTYGRDIQIILTVW